MTTVKHLHHSLERNVEGLFFVPMNPETYRERVIDLLDWMLMSVEHDESYSFEQEDLEKIFSLGYQLKDTLLKAKIITRQDISCD